MVLSTEQYKFLLKRAKNKDIEAFFKWLTFNPDFMDLEDIEIEINFLINELANDSFLLGYCMGCTAE